MREHEKLRGYPKALAAARALETVARTIPDSHRDLRDQLRKAANSVVLNLSEGANEYSPSEKARFYRMSRRSVGECQTALDLVEATVPTPAQTQAARDLLDEVSAFLTTLIHAQQARLLAARRARRPDDPQP